MYEIPVVGIRGTEERADDKGDEEFRKVGTQKTDGGSGHAGHVLEEVPHLDMADKLAG